MAEDDSDRTNEIEAERETEIESELERVGRDSDEVPEEDQNLGTQSAPSGEPRESATGRGDEPAEADEEEEDEEDRAETEETAEAGGEEAADEAEK